MSQMCTLFPERAFHGSSSNDIVCVYDGEWSFPSVDVQIPVELDQDPLEIPVYLVSSVKWNEIMVKYQENVTSGFFPPHLLFSSSVFPMEHATKQHLVCKALSYKKAGPDYVPWCHSSSFSLAKEELRGFHNL